MKKIAIFGCPRSGTSYLGQILNYSEKVTYRYQPLWSYEFKDFFFKKKINDKNVKLFHEKLYQAKSSYVLTSLRNTKKKLTHLVWKEVRYHNIIKKLLKTHQLNNIIYIFRKPEAVINSWYDAPGEFKKNWNIYNEYFYAKKINKKKYDYYGLFKWIKSGKEILKLNNKKIIFICYEDLEKNPSKLIKKLFSKININYTKKINIFINKTKKRTSLEQYSIYKKKSKMKLPIEIYSKIIKNKKASKIYNNLKIRSI